MNAALGIAVCSTSIVPSQPLIGTDQQSSIPFPNPFLLPFYIEFWDISELGTDFQCLLNLKDIALLRLGTQHVFEEVQQLYSRVDQQ